MYAITVYARPTKAKSFRRSMDTITCPSPAAGKTVYIYGLHSYGLSSDGLSSDGLYKQQKRRYIVMAYVVMAYIVMAHSD